MTPWPLSVLTVVLQPLSVAKRRIAPKEIRIFRILLIRTGKRKRASGSYVKRRNHGKEDGTALGASEEFLYNRDRAGDHEHFTLHIAIFQSLAKIPVFLRVVLQPPLNDCKRRDYIGIPKRLID